ncbi:unnamed protein product [Choristocarpus tenellus]
MVQPSMGTNAAVSGVIPSCGLYWVCIDAEVRVYRMDCYSHQCSSSHDMGLPLQAHFLFQTSTGRPLLTRDLSIAYPDGNLVLVCLASAQGLLSEMHCLDPWTGTRLLVVDCLPIMLTHLVMVYPTKEDGCWEEEEQWHAMHTQHSSEAQRGNFSNGTRGGTALTVAVAGIGGGVNCLGLEVCFMAVCVCLLLCMNVLKALKHYPIPYSIPDRIPAEGDLLRILMSLTL